MFRWPLVLALIPLLLGAFTVGTTWMAILSETRAARARGGRPKNVSFVGLVPSLMMWGAAAAYISSGHPWIAIAALVPSVFDLGGPHWFLIMIVAMRRRE